MRQPHSNSFFGAFSVLLIGLMYCQLASAERIKDLAFVDGVRENQLVGYGLVVGLKGTGDTTPVLEQSMKSLLSRFGVKLPGNQKTNAKNAATVVVHASLPPFAKAGQTIDLTVSSLGNAKSLQGGALLLTQLRGLDGQTYAIGQGNVFIGGFGIGGKDGSKGSVEIPSAGRIPDGAIVERGVKTNFQQRKTLVLNLHKPDFTTATAIAKRINDELGKGTASALDASSVELQTPRSANDRVEYVSMIEKLILKPGEAPARVIVNSRTGTVVISRHVKVMPVAVSHGSLMVSVNEAGSTVNGNGKVAKLGMDGNAVIKDAQAPEEDPEGVNAAVIQDHPMFLLNPGVSLNDIVQAVNQVGASPGDLTAILEALKAAGALQAKLIIL